MNILLIVHIVLAIITLFFSAKVLVDVRQLAASLERSVRVMWSSFTGVALSGIALVIVSPATIGHACVLMTLYVVMTSSIQIYQKHVVTQRV